MTSTLTTFIDLTLLFTTLFSILGFIIVLLCIAIDMYIKTYYIDHSSPVFAI